MFSEQEKNAARVIVSIFETSKKQGNPAALVVLDDGAGISYGMHQATHRAGSLEEVVRAFAYHAPAHKEYALKWADALHDRTPENILRMSRKIELKQWLLQAGRSPEMIQAQEEIFATRYFEPALAECNKCKFVEPLSLAVLYDSFIQGSWGKVKEATNEKHHVAVDEKTWIKDYLQQRIYFLSRLASQAARNSIYRPKAFQDLIKQNNWSLTPPFTVRTITVNAGDLL